MLFFRELFSDFFQSLFGYPLAQLMADSPTPAAAQLLYNQMMRDILGGGGHSDTLEQVGSGGRIGRVCVCSRIDTVKLLMLGGHIHVQSVSGWCVYRACLRVVYGRDNSSSARHVEYRVHVRA